MVIRFTGGEAKEAPELPTVDVERTVPPIAALSSSHSAKQAGHSTMLKKEESGTDIFPAPSSHEVNVPCEMDPNDDTSWSLCVSTDNVEYSREEMDNLLETLRENNKSVGGLKHKGRYFGLVGFVRFTSGYHMVLISRRSVVALLGGHYIYHCDETKMLPIFHYTHLSNVPGRTKAKENAEANLLHTFSQVDLSKNFYFSYTYDLTSTLQVNMTGPCVSSDAFNAGSWNYNEKFIWNYYLLIPAFRDCRHTESQTDAQEDTVLEAKRQWVLPMVHGFADQAKLSVLGRVIYITLIARRSRHFAGARFHKRGINPHGYVANDVETEQVVNEPITSSFFAPNYRSWAPHPRYRASPRFTSFVMVRGSIPVFWTQDTSNMSPRPPITISHPDPYYTPAMQHFDVLFRAYGTPVIVLNLVKSKERQPRESKLLQTYTECVQQLNQFLPGSDDLKRSRKIRYIAWDMSRASKSQDQDVIETLETIAKNTIAATGYFHSGPLPQRLQGQSSPGTNILLQHGITRVNCVDCLDRTNAAQFVIGKEALAQQLHALGLLEHSSLSFDSEMTRMLTEMYHDLGDTIALQYGGSALAHKTDTYRKINRWTSHSRDMVEGLRRYYANSFADADKQAAIDLFLGQEQYGQEEMPVIARWDIQSFKATEEALVQDENMERHETYMRAFANANDQFWDLYYRPSLFTDLQRHHAFKMTAVLQQLSIFPGFAYPSLNTEASLMVDPTPSTPPSVQATDHLAKRTSLLGDMQRWMRPAENPSNKSTTTQQHSASVDCSQEASAQRTVSPAWTDAASTMGALLDRILHPVISKQEQREYFAYATQFKQFSFGQVHRATGADLHVYDTFTSLSSTPMQLQGNYEPNRADPTLLNYMRFGQAARNLSHGSHRGTPPPDPPSMDAKVRTFAAWLHAMPAR
ncbi:phosphatidylinositol-3,5-bisphosphate 5-phosphatase [Malassezia vespertilionis]|uniref:phosphatidylinositol-3,5-bisphosphate 5-phosphatase n=1 Tax=Malassezia vespertilionis TaxID=2020962 RepID=UPI0024B1CBF0|nr:phosphatidylinositol-3,5-bisphosphate 5-phosphatase [Malassezia vespertilionis]WFD04735.1 phosphatidylinositol-3,5-bisphosphate 5-phosphatase [Malassezia vespertilionis]